MNLIKLTTLQPIEQVIVGYFTEIKRHKPSVIYIPNIEVWHAALRDSVAMITFQTMLKGISATDPVLLLATAECEADRLDPVLLKDLFGYSRKNRKGIDRPEQVRRCSCTSRCPIASCYAFTNVTPLSPTDESTSQT